MSSEIRPLTAEEIEYERNLQNMPGLEIGSARERLLATIDALHADLVEARRVLAEFVMGNNPHCEPDGSPDDKFGYCDLCKRAFNALGDWKPKEHALEEGASV